jgi:hypothetical protein
VGVGRQAVFATLALLAACQCESISDTACFAGEACDHDDGGRGGGVADGGGSEAGGGGSLGGGAAGAGGGGQLQYVPIPDAFSDAGICEDPMCITTAWPPRVPTPPMFTHVDLSIPDGGFLVGSPQFRGGVTLMDGRVLLIPVYATSFMLVDPIGQTVRAVGPSFMGFRPHFGAGVLGCDGRVYVLPDAESRIVRFTLEADGGLHDDGFDTALSGVSGAVVTGPCDDGLLHLAVVTQTAWYELDIDETGVLPYAPHTMVQPVAPQGITRTGDGYLIGAAPDHFVSVIGSQATDVPSGVTSGSAIVFYGSAYISDGRVMAFDTQDVAIVGLNSSARSFGAPAKVGASRWPLARGDGFIYGLASELRAVEEKGTLWADGGLKELPVCIDCGDAGPLSSGLVNGAGGTIVAAPVDSPTVRVFVPQPDGGAPPRSVVLSPFLDRF